MPLTSLCRLSRLTGIILSDQFGDGFNHGPFTRANGFAKWPGCRHEDFVGVRFQNLDGLDNKLIERVAGSASLLFRRSVRTHG